MAASFTSQNRPLILDTPFGPDKLLVRSFTATEGISQLFSVQLGLVSEDRAIKFDDIIGKNVTLSLRLGDGNDQRFFNGIVSRFAQLPSEDHFAIYELEMVPWLWLLTRTADCLIFQNKNVPDIVRAVFKRHNQTDFEFSPLQRKYREWEYSAQYRETACRYVMRLLEQEGLYFFFRHEKGKHTMVIGDSASAHKPCPGQSKVKFSPALATTQHRADGVINAWRVEQEIRPGKYSLNDFNFETPGTSLLVSEPSRINQGGNQNFEIYDYPGEYDTRPEGEDYVRARMEEEEVPHAVFSGSSDCRTLASGFQFELTDFDVPEPGRKDQNGKYLLTTIIHNGHQTGITSGTLADDNLPYSNSFTCVPIAVPFRPLRVTPKPLVQGSQTAIVVGPKGEEIFTDKFGRVKVQFHWDREGKHDENTTCFIRVSQPWAGTNWGAIFLPRIGQEVIVDFLEGDPDQPIITGRVYNADNMPPCKLPDHQTRSGIITRSTPKGSSSTFNEILFEDKKGSELLKIHAELNKTETVEADSVEHVGHDRKLIVENDQKEHVKNNKHLHVNGDHKVKVEGSYFHHVLVDRAEKTDTGWSHDCGGAIQIKSGNEICFEAPEQFSIKCGGNFIVLNAAGIFIQGTMVMINSGGVPGICIPFGMEDPEDPDPPEGGSKGS